MGMERIDVQTLADLAFDKIERAILAGDLPPGTPLGEVELAAQLGVSRGPLREAIQRLEGRRLLQRVPHVGVRVALLPDREVGEIFAIREVLEGLAAALAAQHMTVEELDGLEACTETRLRRPTEDAPSDRPDSDFHVRVARGSRNHRLIQQLCVDMYSQLRLYRIRSGSTEMRAGSADEHREILGAMRARDPARAELLMRAHVRRARESLVLLETESDERSPRPRRVARAEAR